MDSEYILEVMMNNLVQELLKKSDITDADWTKTAEDNTNGVLIVKNKDGEFSFNLVHVYPAHITA